MKGTMVVISTNGVRVTAELDDEPTLETLQEKVGGYIRDVPGFTKYEGQPCLAYCDEDGLPKGLPLNALATDLWHKQMPPIDDYLVGNVVILYGDNDFMKAVTEGPA
jgi:hypothetical protein